MFVRFSTPPAATVTAPSICPFAQLTTVFDATLKAAPDAIVPLIQFNVEPPITESELPELIVPLVQFNVMLESVSVALLLRETGPLKFWRKVAVRLMEATMETNRDLGRSPDAIGKSSNHWKNLYNEVAMQEIMVNRVL